MITRRAGQMCEACGAAEDRTVRRWLEAHERWAYDDRSGVQALRRLICLCADCHLSTHLGYANVSGHTDQALAHLRRVNGWDHARTLAHYAAENLWIDRSAHTWTLDLSMLTDAGVTLARPERADHHRLAAAERALCREQQRGAPEPIPQQWRSPLRMPSIEPRLQLDASPEFTATPAPRRGLWACITGK